MSLNINQLIENVSISDNSENRLMNKIKDNFKDTGQQLFIANFYCFLKYDTKILLLISITCGNGWDSQEKETLKQC